MNKGNFVRLITFCTPERNREQGNHLTPGQKKFTNAGDFIGTSNLPGKSPSIFLNKGYCYNKLKWLIYFL